MIYNAPIKDMLFLLTEWQGLDKFTALPGFEEVDNDLVEAILDEAAKFCSTEVLPLNRDSDEHGAVFRDGKVSTPPGFREAYQQFIDNGWTSIVADPNHGGQGLPKVLQGLLDEMLSATSLSFKLYTELSQAAYHLLDTTAPDAIREAWLPKMVDGTWSGTMCLTEPHCGTDLGLLNTKAVPNGDGSYSITGSKIFITSGDHDLTENILHLVIARIEGAPSGSRGISLFLVPKYRVNDDLTIGDWNQVTTASIEHKMGIKGSATCTLNFDGANGILIGDENRGLAAMFKMMNTERLKVGIQAIGIADIAYQNALAYAKERLQSRAPGDRPDSSKPADPILYQPEIQRQLLTIRALVEGTRALTVYAGGHIDVMERGDGEAATDAAHAVALLTPIIKAFGSDVGLACALSAQQVYGGHGYVREHGMEQLVRDCRITQIYEGTNEVQAQDLVARKLTGETGEFADRFLAGWQDYFAANADVEGVADIVRPTAEALRRLVETTAWMRDRLETEPADALGAAYQYLQLFGLTVIACLWTQIVVSIDGKEGAFYASKRKLARFYVNQVLPDAGALVTKITGGSAALAGFDIADFDA